MQNNLTMQIRDRIDNMLEIKKYSDYCYNGMQVENSGNVFKIASAVTASMDAINKAISLNANLLIVHHGLFWKGDALAIQGPTYKRLRGLLANDIALFAYHLPLDENKDHGNNALIGQALGIPAKQQFDLGLMQPSLGRYAHVNMDPAILERNLFSIMKQKPQHFDYGSSVIKTIAWCSGAAQDGILQAHKLGADAYISGEVSERTFHYAKELGIHYYAVGHHASERFGVISLATAVAKEFQLQHEYIELSNPV